METYLFEADESMRKHAVKTLRAHSPCNWMLIAVAVLCIPWAVICYQWINGELLAADVTGMGPAASVARLRGTLALCVTFLLAATPLVIALVSRYRYVDGPLMKRRGETILLGAKGLQQQYMYCYEHYRRPGVWMRYCYTYMAYRDIQRIEYFPREKALKVYGKTYFCSAPGEPEPDSVLKVLDKPSQAYRVFFLYYPNGDELVRRLAEKTHLPINTQEPCRVSLQEKMNKGVG